MKHNKILIIKYSHTSVAWNADALNDADTELAEKDEEENEKVEWTVTPAMHTKTPLTPLITTQVDMVVTSNWWKNMGCSVGLQTSCSQT